MRLLALALLLSACAPAPAQASTPARCAPTELRCHLRYAIWPQAPHLAQASILPAVRPVLAAIDPANPDALQASDLLDGATAALKAGNYLLLVVLGAMAALWALRTGALRISDAEYTWFHSTWGTVISSAGLGLLLSAFVALKAGAFTWASLGTAGVAALVSLATAWINDRKPGAAVAAAAKS